MTRNLTARNIMAMKTITVAIALTVSCSSLFAFKFEDFAGAVAGEIINEALNNETSNQQETSPQQTISAPSPEDEAKRQAEEEAKRQAEEEAKRQAEEEKSAKDEFESVKEYMHSLSGKMAGLKAKAAEQDTLSFKGFYAGMPIQDACDLYNYYFMNDQLDAFETIQSDQEIRYHGIVDETVSDGEYVGILGRVTRNSADYQGNSMWIGLSPKLGKRIHSSGDSYVQNGKGTKQGELTLLELDGYLVDKMWGVKSLSGEKFAELFVENYFTKNLGNAWSSLVDQTIEHDDNYNPIYVWENTKHGYRLKLHTVDKKITLESIRKQSEITFD